MPTNQNIGTVNKPYVSLVPYLDQLNVWNKISDLQNDGEWASFMDFTGKARTVQSSEWWYDSFYNDPKNIVIDTTGATITNSGTATVTITNLTSGNNDYLKVTDTVRVPRANKKTLVTAVTTTTLTRDTVTLKTDTGVITLVAGDKIVASGSAMEAGSTAPDPMRFNLTSIRNLVQIFSQVCKIDDVQGGALRTVEINGDFHAYDQNEIDAYQKMQAQFAQTWFDGQISADLFSDTSGGLGPTGGPVQMTRGLNQYIETYGSIPQVLTPGIVTGDDIASMEDQLIAQKAPFEYMGVGSVGALRPIGTYLNGLGSSAAQSVRLNKTAADGTSVNFYCTEWTSEGGFHYMFKPLKLLTNPQTFNFVASGSNKTVFATSIFLMPNGECPVYGGTTGDGGTQPYYMMRFCPPTAKMYQQALGSAGRLINSNGQVATFSDGAYAGVGTTMALTTRLYGQMGVQIQLPQHFARFNTTGSN